MGDSCPTSGNLEVNLAISGTIDTFREASNSITVTNATLLPGTHLRISNGSEEELIVYNGYDELGQLVQKKVGGSASSLTDFESTAGLQTISYKYNVRGWLKSINDPADLGDALFGFGIKYNDIADPSKRLYNGNISQTLWKSKSQNITGNPVSERYSYGYNALNWITSATDNTGNYGLSNVSYDKNGNIMSLKRQGHTVLDGNGQVTTFGVMDDLDYGYDSGNKLIKVSDTGNDAHGFLDDAVNIPDTQDDYGYDNNGNLLADANKGITAIEYDHLNLPVKITINGNGHVGNIVYIYDARGTKLKKITTEGSSVTTTDYAGNHIYENGQLQFFSHPEGYVTPGGQGGFDYVYQYKDHLGNGAYFITICTQSRGHFFGKINDGKMVLSHVGVVADILWHEIPNHSKYVELGDFVVMPNHIHGILILDKTVGIDANVNADANRDNDNDNAGTLHTMSLPRSSQSESPGNEHMAKISPRSGSISTIIRSYKSAVTKHANRLGLENGWQSRFHDHIIRNDAEYQRISNYIINNPANWKDDKFI